MDYRIDILTGLEQQKAHALEFHIQNSDNRKIIKIGLTLITFGTNIILKRYQLELLMLSIRLGWDMICIKEPWN